MGAYINYSRIVSLTDAKMGIPMEQYTYDEFDLNVVEEICANPRLEVFQISDYMPESVFPLVNELFKRRPDVTFRVFGFYGEECCNISFLEKLPDVQSLSLDCIRNVAPIEVIKNLKLKYLRLDVHLMEDFSIINDLDEGLEEFSVFKSLDGKDNLDIRWLLRFKNLKKLYLGKFKKHIEAVGQMPNLRYLTLRGVSCKSFDFLENLLLDELKIHWCAAKGIETLAGLKNVKALELWRINKLEDVSFLRGMTALEVLKLQDLAQITSFPDMSESHLKEVTLDNLKSLKDISGLSKSPALKKAELIGLQKLDAEDYRCILVIPDIEAEYLGVGSNKKHAAVEAIEKEYRK